MKKLLIAILFAITFSTPAFAVNCNALNVPDLPDAVLIELKQRCVEAVSKPAPISVSQVSEYAELGKNYGIALSEVAKSVGTTVNDLAQTPVGKFMLVMVVYKVMGHDLIGIAGGFIWFCIMIPLWVYFFNRLVLKNRAYREYIEVREKDNQPKVVRREYDPLKYEDGTGVMAFFLSIALIMICGAGFLMVF